MMFLSKEIKEKTIEFIKNKFEVQFIYLFGSFAKGEGREDSDIDLAIYGDSMFDTYELFIIANELSFIINRDVQLIDLRDVSTVFSAQIVGNKEVLFCRDENLCFEYDIKAFKNYIKLNEERQVVIEAIRRDGRING